MLKISEPMYVLPTIQKDRQFHVNGMLHVSILRD